MHFFPLVLSLFSLLAMQGPAHAQVSTTSPACPAVLQHTVLRLQDEKPQNLCQYALPTLQTTRDPDIFAMGDCAACPWPEANEGQGGFVPPRAQAAHQQASHLFKQIQLRLENKPLKPYHYRDFGSLVSLGKYSTVGNMMGGLIGGSLMIEGVFAKLMYLSLYKMHELALHGWAKVSLDTLARMITRRTEPHVKLH